MKHRHTNQFVLGLSLAIITATPVRSDPAATQIHQPVLDSEGRFWIYRNGPLQPKMPFAPYGWMSDGTNLSKIIQIDLDCRDHPEAGIKPPRPERELCISLKVAWSEATWASVAFISGTDKPPWWGETNSGGKYYDLGALPQKRLVFYARGSRNGDVIKAQIGALGDKPFGDSLPKPIVTEELKLTQEWKRFEIDFKGTPAADLASICNGFGVVLELASQPGSPAETQVYLDNIYFE
jgi:hypothetical protein